jgi:magnesium chelatase family protein
MREGRVLLQRAMGSVVFPAAFQLVAATNPCPCGFRGHPRRPCGCSDEVVARYMNRNLLDLTMRVDLQPVDAGDLVSDACPEDSATVRARVVAARERMERETPLFEDDAAVLLGNAYGSDWNERRSWERCTAVARCVAALDGSSRIRDYHVAEAVLLYCESCVFP